jgi:hypothetical protein
MVKRSISNYYISIYTKKGVVRKNNPFFVQHSYSFQYLKFSMLTPKTTTLAIVCLLLSGICFGQQKDLTPNISAKWGPAGLTAGSLNLHGEYNFGGKHSLTAKIGIPVNARHTIHYEDKDATFDVKATSFLAGYRTYLSNKHLAGLYFEPFFKYVHHTGEGVGNGTLDNKPASFNFTNDYNAVGIGAQLGIQFLIRNKYVIDFFFLGPEINSARNTFKAREITSTLYWNTAQQEDAEQVVRDFINQFPFVRNHTTIMVDRESKMVTASFNGALPGYRIGVSFGMAF